MAANLPFKNLQSFIFVIPTFYENDSLITNIFNE